jgi:hypothetical protein
MKFASAHKHYIIKASASRACVVSFASRPFYFQRRGPTVPRDRTLDESASWWELRDEEKTALAGNRNPVVLLVLKISVPTPQTTHRVSSTKTSQLILLSVIITVYPGNHTTHLSAQCRQNAEGL